MKKILVLVCVLVLALSASAYAADIKIGGGFEASGVSLKDSDFDSATDDDSSTWYGNLVLSLEAKVNDNITVFGSYTMIDRNWGDAGAYNTDSGFSNATGFATDDVAYAEITLDKVTVVAGRMLDEWGHMLWTTGDGIDRLGVAYAMSDALKIGLEVDKVNELDDPTLDGDEDSMGIYAAYETKEMKAGAYLADVTSDSGLISELSGNAMDIYYEGAPGGVGLKAELTMQSGDMYESATGDNPMALFVSAEKELGTLTLGGTIAYAKNGYVAGPYFNPTAMVGTDQSMALNDFGGEHTVGDDTAMTIALGVDYSLSDKWSLGAKLASHTFSDAADTSGTEINLQAEYKIADGATWGIYVAQMSPDGMSASDDAATGMMHTLAIEF